MRKQATHFKRIILFVLIILIGFWLIPVIRFPDDKYSQVLEDRNGQLLGARIASDGQWRFPVNSVDTLDPKYIAAVIEFEDKRFYKHFGLDIRAIFRALSQNIKEGRTVSGGSTLTMQAVSLQRGFKANNFFQKLIEILLSLRLDMAQTKNQILMNYARHAPFGGNTVGYGAATWRYFGKHHKSLTWSEATLLAILPNNPSMIHLARNRNALLKKRNLLLQKLSAAGHFNRAQLVLYQEEPLPDKPHPMPDLAPQLLTSMKKLYGQNHLSSTVDLFLQNQINEVAFRYGLTIKANQVHNLAVIVAEVNTGNILAYTGNLPGTGRVHGDQVDIIQAQRSTGSLLKPFLTMASLEDGMITPHALMADIPVNIDGFRPENFNNKYSGAVDVTEALQKSYNVPFVLLLKDYNASRFLSKLRQLGFGSLNQPAGHYGLSLIIGGAESSLWELTGAYATCGRILNRFTSSSGDYSKYDIHPLKLSNSDSSNEITSKSPDVLGAGSIYQTFEMMSGLSRPGRFFNWDDNDKTGRIAWKTGTSIGFRDAWAIGLNQEYVVGVWIGNADGEGRPGVIGLETAAPLLFEVFNLLPQSKWFTQPYDDMTIQPVCANSGYAPNQSCPVDSVWTNKNLSQLKTCNYDVPVTLDQSGLYRVNSTCYDVFKMQSKSYFVLPTNQAHFYQSSHINYISLPPLHPDCQNSNPSSPMSMIYPVNISKIYIPKSATGELNPITLEAAHIMENAIVYWHIDDTYYGSTSRSHRFSAVIPQGKHSIKCIDQAGNEVSSMIEIIHSEK